MSVAGIDHGIAGCGGVQQCKILVAIRPGGIANDSCNVEFAAMVTVPLS